MSNKNTPNLVHLNHFIADAIDIWGFGNNGDPAEGGTQINCNNFDRYIAAALLAQDYNPPSSFVLPFEAGSLDDQGDCNDLFLTLQHPADNTFTELVPGSYEIFSDTPLPNFTYYTRPDAGGITYVPATVTSNVDVQLCNSDHDVQTNCGGTPPKPPGDIKIIVDERDRDREAAKKLYEYWEEGADSATIAQLFDELYTSQSYRKMLPYYIAQGDAAKYNAAMNELPDSDTDTHYFKQLQQLYWQLNQSGRTYMQLNTEEEATVRQIAHSSSRAAFDAHALLYLVYGEEFEVPLPPLPLPIAVIIGTNNLGSFAFKTADNTGNYLKISPNPVAENAEITYHIPDHETATWQLYDISGQLIMQKTLQNNGKVSIDLSVVSQGIYYYMLSLNGNLVQTDKIAIIK